MRLEDYYVDRHSPRQIGKPTCACSMKTKMIMVIAVICALMSGSLAETTKAGWFFCLTKEDALRAALYLRDGDNAALCELETQKRLYGLKEGVEVRVVAQEAGLVKFRMKGSTVEFWTVIEALGL